MMRLETEQMAAVTANQGSYGRSAPRGVWVAYSEDHSSVVPCETELEALRFAVGHSLKVALVPFGKCVWEVTR